MQHNANIQIDNNFNNNFIYIFFFEQARDTWSRIEDLFDRCLWRRSTRPAIISLGTISRSLKNSAKRLATSEYASCRGQQQRIWNEILSFMLSLRTKLLCVTVLMHLDLISSFIPLFLSADKIKWALSDMTYWLCILGSCAAHEEF